MARSKTVRVSEKDIENTCADFLRLDGWQYEHQEAIYDNRKGKGVGKIGMADGLAIRPFKFEDRFSIVHLSLAHVLKIEWKAKGGVLSTEQCKWHMEHRALGFVTVVAGADFPKSIEGFQYWYRKSGLMVTKI